MVRCIHRWHLTGSMLGRLHTSRLSFDRHFHSAISSRDGVAACMHWLQPKILDAAWLELLCAGVCWLKQRNSVEERQYHWEALWKTNSVPHHMLKGNRCTLTIPQHDGAFYKEQIPSCEYRMVWKGTIIGVRVQLFFVPWSIQRLLLTHVWKKNTVSQSCKWVYTVAGT